MSRALVAASSQYIEVDSAPVAAAPLTMACWFNSNDLTATQTLIFIGDKDTEVDHFAIRAAGVAGGDPVQAFIRDAGGLIAVNTSSGFSANTWHHAAYVGAAVDDHAVFIDGGSKGTSVTSITPANSDRLTIGRLGDSSPSGYMSGMLAEVAIWNVALSDAEVARHALGYSAKFIRPDNLVAYATMVRDLQEVIGGLVLTNNGSIVAAHPRIFLPGLPLYVMAPSAPQSIDPAAIPAPSVVQAPSLSGSGAAPISPAALAAPALVQAPALTATGAAPMSPAPIIAPSAVQAPSLSGSGAAPMSPPAVFSVTSVGTPSIRNVADVLTNIIVKAMRRR